MSLQIERIRAICFDIDGTLSNTDDQWVKRFQRLLRPIRFAFQQQQTRPFARRLVMGLEAPGNYAYEVLDRLHLDAAAARLFNNMVRLDQRRKAPRFWIVPEVVEMLKALNRRYPLAVVSARGEQSSLAFLDQFELLPLFTAVATALTCEHTKPYPDPLIWAAQQMGVAPQACLMVGDTTVDIRTGRAAGAQTVGVLCGFGEDAELRRAGADLILPGTADLLSVLNSELE